MCVAQKYGLEISPEYHIKHHNPKTKFGTHFGVLFGYFDGIVDAIRDAGYKSFRFWFPFYVIGATVDLLLLTPLVHRLFMKS